jgi:DNA-binding protein
MTTENTQSSDNKDSGSRDSGSRDTVYIGKKPLMAYVTSTLIQLANIPSVRIKARGMSIGRAVDVSQIISRKTENAGYLIGEIILGSEALESQDGKTRNVSTIEIEVKRK